jgi:hypothetical protein
MFYYLRDPKLVLPEFLISFEYLPKRRLVPSASSPMTIPVIMDETTSEMKELVSIVTSVAGTATKLIGTTDDMDEMLALGPFPPEVSPIGCDEISEKLLMGLPRYSQLLYPPTPSHP